MNEVLYIQSAESLIERYNRLSVIIEKMENSLINPEIDDSTEYFILDDGQSKITRAFRNPKEITSALERFDLLRKRILNQLNGHDILLRDNGVLRR